MNFTALNKPINSLKTFQRPATWELRAHVAYLSGAVGLFRMPSPHLKNSFQSSVVDCSVWWFCFPGLFCNCYAVVLWKRSDEVHIIIFFYWSITVLKKFNGTYLIYVANFIEFKKKITYFLDNFLSLHSKILFYIEEQFLYTWLE